MKPKLIATILICLICTVSTYGCTVFSIKQDGNVYVGNNEDWYIPYPKYRITPSREGTYGRIIFSYNNNWGQGGMNEKGLFFDWILNPEASNTWKRDTSKKDLIGNLSEKILSECATVEEALRYYEEYNEPIFKTSYIVLVDTSGHTAFVSWSENGLNIEHCNGVCAGGYRPDKAVEKYKELGGSINKSKVSLLLDAAHQEGEYPTLYSNIYDLKNGIIHLFHYHNYEEEIVLDLQKELKKGKHSVELKDIFETQIPIKTFRKLQKKYVIEELKTIPLKGWGVVALLLGFIVTASVVTIKVAKKILRKRSTPNKA